VKRLVLVLLLVASCDRSTPSLPGVTSASPTQTVVLSTAAPRATRAQTAAGLPRPPSDATGARVARVTDGDTIVLVGISAGEVDRSTGGRKARLIGIDTPEVFGGEECFGRKASDFTKRELDGERVLVDFDVDTVDRYGRALVYVWTSDGSFFNARLVAEGFALQATFPPNVRYVELFTRLARSARADGRGLWESCG
jgi:micrococcal nuclease